MFNGFPGWGPPGHIRGGGSGHPTDPLQSAGSSPDRLGPRDNLSGLHSRPLQQDGYHTTRPRTASPVRAAGASQSNEHLNRLAQNLDDTGVPEHVQAPLLAMLAAAAATGRPPGREMEALVGTAQQAVTGLLTAPRAPSPRAAEAAAHALMAGIAALPHPAARADRATLQFLQALQTIPSPQHAGELPAYGRRLEATARAILAAAPLVPPQELQKGLSAVAQFPTVFAQRIAPGVFQFAAPQHQKPLLDHVGALQHAVLETLPRLPQHLRHEPLTHLSGQLAHAQFGLHRTPADTGPESLYPGLTVDLLAAVGELPPQDRHAPLQALKAALLTTSHFSQPPAMTQMRQRLLQAVDEMQWTVAAGHVASLRQELWQQARHVAQDHHPPGIEQLIRQGMARMHPRPGEPGWQP